MAENELNDLMKRMGEIAKAVNAFKSEAVQQTAFAALIDAFNGSDARDDTLGETAGESKKADGKKAAPVKSKTGTSKGKTKVDSEVNLRPQGKKSFVDFIAEKKPSSNQDKFAVVVFYLEQIAQIPAVSLAHIGFVFRVTPGWREPANLDVAVRVAATRKATIDVSDANDIKTTPQGRNFVEHDLPEKEG
jgi:hypothetical protein